MRNKTRLAEVQVAKTSDFGKNDITYNTVTHLGMSLYRVCCVSMVIIMWWM
jgi:hypothetical protein